MCELQALCRTPCCLFVCSPCEDDLCNFCCVSGDYPCHSADAASRKAGLMLCQGFHASWRTGSRLKLLEVNHTVFLAGLLACLSWCCTDQPMLATGLGCRCRPGAANVCGAMCSLRKGRAFSIYSEHASRRCQVMFSWASMPVLGDSQEM